jgi:fluoride exporter
VNPFQDPNLRIPLAIALGAIPGALSRYYLTIGLARWLGNAFPYGTFAINLTGAFVMGWLGTWSLERGTLAPEVRLLITAGFLGSYTTFSTYTLDTLNLLRGHTPLSGWLYWGGSAILGLLAVVGGSAIARRFF